METALWLSAADCHRLAPEDDFATTARSLETEYKVSTALRCWHLEHVSVSLIDESQLWTDTEALDIMANIEAYRHMRREGRQAPPVTVIHCQDASRWPFFLLEGMRRYNAAYQEGADSIAAWVGHFGCCGGPASDLR